MVLLADAMAIAVAVTLVTVAAAGAVLAAPVTLPAGTWGTAIEVPGLAALNATGRAEVQSVSCGPVGDCAAGGSYRDGAQNVQGFVITEQDGTWGNAIEVPGLAALNVSGQAEVLTVSCGPAGGCAAGGYYYDARNAQQGFVITEQDGTWGNAIEVPGLARLSKGFAEVLSVSCGPAGDCAAGGFYQGRRGQQGFVVSEQNGTWAKAVVPPGLTALNAGGLGGRDVSAAVSAVSCDPAGACAAGGYYKDRGNHQQGFVVGERKGTWGKATAVPGLNALNAQGQAAITSVSCTSPGNCAAGGYYKDLHAHWQGFVATKQNGTWAKATAVPGLNALNVSGFARVSSVDCSTTGNCAAGGNYSDRHRHGQGFVVSEQNGTWRTAIAVPGLTALNAGRSAKVSSLSCSTAGNCAAGGSYQDSQRIQQAFVVSEQNGTWGNAVEVPGLASLNSGVAWISSVSCGPAGGCAAGGFYQDRHRSAQGFVISQS